MESNKNQSIVHHNLKLKVGVYELETYRIYDLKTEMHIMLTQTVNLQHAMLRQCLLVQPVFVFQNEQITEVYLRFHSILQISFGNSSCWEKTLWVSTCPFESFHAERMLNYEPDLIFTEFRKTRWRR